MIRILFADESPRITSKIMKRLEQEDGVALCGTARDGEIAFQEALRLHPDIVVIDASLPGMDGLQTTELLSQHLPYTGVILTSLDSENDSYRHAMLAGAREYLSKPYRSDDLIAAVHRVFEFEQKRQTISQTNTPHDAGSAGAPILEHGMFMTILSGQGGSGKSMIATNLALDLVRTTKKKVILLDLSLQFGDIGALLNLPSQRTIVDLAANDAVTDMETIQQAIVPGPEGVDVLLAPLSPEQADYVSTTHLRALVENLRQEYQYIIADTASYLSEIILDAIEMSDRRVVVFDPSVTGIKNARLLLSVLSVLNVDTSTITLVTNNRENGPGIDRAEMQKFLLTQPQVEIPYDGQSMNTAQLHATPILMFAPQVPASMRIHDITLHLTGEAPSPDAATPGAAPGQAAADDSKKKRKYFGFAK